MSQFNNLSSERIEELIYEQLESIRIQKNISQTELAESAGISRRTISRMENGQGISFNTFIRIMQAFHLTDRLSALFATEAEQISPVDRVQEKRKSVRYRASGKRKKKSSNKKSDQRWEWDDE